MYKNILVPLDGSRLAEAPLDYAVWLAQKSGAELTLLHVYKGKVPDISRYLVRLNERIERRIRGGAGIAVKLEISSGDPASEIVNYAEDNKIDLITMSTHGRTGIKRWIMGSVADKVLHSSKRPVRLVKSFVDSPEQNTEPPDRTILVLLDGSEIAEKIIPYAAYHAGMSEGELILLSVCVPPDIMSPVTYHLIPDSYPRTRPVQWYKYAEQETELRHQQCGLYLDRIEKILKEKGLQVRRETPMGNPVDEIVGYLEKNPVNLVMMTTRGRSGFTRWAFGSVAEKVLVASPGAIFIIKP